MNNAMDMAKGRWKNILMSFGIAEVYLTGKHGPCLFCDGKDRWRWIAEKERYVCNQCTPDPADGMDLLMRYTGKTFHELAKEIESMSGVKKDRPAPKRNPMPLLDHIASQCVPLDGINPVRLYLRNRGIKVISRAIRYCECMRYYQDGKFTGNYPAMVSRVTNKTGQRETYHITYLTKDGQKANVNATKKILPPVNTISGAGVYLGAVASRMIISEGIETGLAGMQMTGIPAIAALSAGGMERIDLPEAVKSVVILADNDLNYRGQVAAYKLAARLATEGKEVQVKVPDQVGDYLDVMTSEGKVFA